MKPGGILQGVCMCETGPEVAESHGRPSTMGFFMACFIRCARTQTFASLAEYVKKSCYQGIEGLTSRIGFLCRLDTNNSHYDHKVCGVILEQPCGAAANTYVF
ncbi:unnamed protein product, partial [Ectocarpus sp. 6 AP-2014]